MSQALTVLSFGWHLPYLRSLAGLGCRIDVVPTWSADVSQPWLGARTLPSSIRFVPHRQACVGFQRRRYDLLVAHHRTDLDGFDSGGVPRVLVVHHSPSLDRLLGGDATLPPAGAVEAIVYPSDRARRAWERDGRVIPPGIDVEIFPRSTLEQARAVRVQHLGAVASARLGGPEDRALVDGLPVTTLGLGTTRDEGDMHRQEAAIAAAMSCARLLLHTPNDPDPMGPAWSVLEAMARGLPVVALAGRCDPVEHGSSGFVDSDLVAVRRHATALVGDADLARHMGLAARRRVTESAGLAAFLDGWRDTIEDLIGG